MKVIAFYQAIGAGLPVLIGIFTASVMEQEQNAGDFKICCLYRINLQHFYRNC